MCVRKIVVRSFQRCAQSNAVAPYCFVPPPIHCGTNALSSVRKLISGACYEMFLCCRRGDRRQTRSSVDREAHDASRSSSSSGRNNCCYGSYNTMVVWAASSFSVLWDQVVLCCYPRPDQRANSAISTCLAFVSVRAQTQPAGTATRS